LSTKTVTESKLGKSRRDKLREKLKEFEKVKNSESASEIKSLLREQQTKSNLSDAVSLLNENISENKELSEKIDYLMNLLLDAADSMSEDTDTTELIEAVARSQVEVLERLGKLDNSVGSSSADTVRAIDKKLDKMITFLESEGEGIEKIASEVEEFKGILNFDKLDSEMASIKESIAKTHEEISSVEKALFEESDSGEHLAKMDALRRTVSGLDSKLESIDTELKGIIPSIYKTESLQGDLVEVKLKLDDLDSKMSENIGEIEAGVSNELKKFENELGLLSGQIKKSGISVEKFDVLKTQVSALLDRFSSFSKQVKSRDDLSKMFAYEIEELETHFDKLESKMNGVEDNIFLKLKPLSAQGRDSGDSRDIKKALDELSKELHATEQAVKSNKDLAVYFDSQVNTIKKELGSVSRDLSAMKRDSPSKGVEALSKNVSMVLGKLKDIEADVYHGQLSSGELKSRLESIESGFKSFESSEDTRVARIAGHLKEVEKRFSEMESHLGSSKAVVSKHDLDEARKAVRSLKNQISTVGAGSKTGKHIDDAKLKLRKEQVSLESGSTKVSTGFADSLSSLKAQLLGVRKQAVEAKSVKANVSRQLDEIKDSIKSVEKASHPEIIGKSKPQIEKMLAKIDGNKKKLSGSEAGRIASHVLRVEEKAEKVKKHFEEKKSSSHLKEAEASIKKADSSAKFGGVSEKEYNRVYSMIKALKSGDVCSVKKIASSANVSVPVAKKAVRSIVGRKDVLAKIEKDSFFHKLAGKQMNIKRL